MQAGGYIAARGLINGVINVFAPCGCVFTFAKTGEQLLTLCMRKGCGAKWESASNALMGLVAMEQTSKGEPT